MWFETYGGQVIRSCGYDCEAHSSNYGQGQFVQINSDNGNINVESCQIVRCPRQYPKYDGPTRAPVSMSGPFSEGGNSNETQSNTSFCFVNFYEGLLRCSSYYNAYIRHNHYCNNAMLVQKFDAFMVFDGVYESCIDNCNFIDNDSKDKNGGFKIISGNGDEYDSFHISIGQCYFYKHLCQYMFWVENTCESWSSISIKNSFGSESSNTTKIERDYPMRNEVYGYIQSGGSAKSFKNPNPECEYIASSVKELLYYGFSK